MIEITNDMANEFYKSAIEQLKTIWELPSETFSGVKPESADEVVFYLNCIFGQSKKTYEELKASAKIVAEKPEFLQIANTFYQETFAYLAPGDERVDEVMYLVKKVDAVIMGELDAEYRFELNKIFLPLGFTSAMIDACIEEDKVRFESEMERYKTIETLSQPGLQAIAIIFMVENLSNNKVSERIAGISDCDLSNIPQETIQLEYNRHIQMYRDIKALTITMAEKYKSWSAYFLNNSMASIVAQELDPIARVLLAITTTILNWKKQLESYFRQISTYNSVSSQKRQRLYELLDKYSSLILPEYSGYCALNNVDEALSCLFGIDKSDSEATRTSKVADYRVFFATVEPKIDYTTMRRIAELLAGKVRVEKSIVQSEVAYIRPKDIPRLCYFFLHKVSSPDKLNNIDFNEPIQWLGHWTSLKYFIFRIYGKPQSLPSNLSEKVVDAFRFPRERSPKAATGQISLKTFKNTPYLLAKVSDEDKNRINNILQEFL